MSDTTDAAWALFVRDFELDGHDYERDCPPGESDLDWRGAETSVERDARFNAMGAPTRAGRNGFRRRRGDGPK